MKNNGYRKTGCGKYSYNTKKELAKKNRKHNKRACKEEA